MSLFNKRSLRAMEMLYRVGPQVGKLVGEVIEKNLKLREDSPVCRCGHIRLDHRSVYDGKPPKECRRCECSVFLDLAKPLVQL